MYFEFYQSPNGFGKVYVIFVRSKKWSKLLSMVNHLKPKRKIIKSLNKHKRKISPLVVQESDREDCLI